MPSALRLGLSVEMPGVRRRDRTGCGNATYSTWRESQRQGDQLMGQSETSPMPVFVIKARDALAIPTLCAYQRECVDHGLVEQADEVAKAITEVRNWQRANIDLTKLPDHLHRTAGQSGSGSEG
jgi:hypothetical protein